MKIKIEHNLWEVASVLLGEKFMLFIIFTSKKEKFNISDLNLYFKKLENKQQINKQGQQKETLPNHIDNFNLYLL